MIYIEQDQKISENENMRVFSPTGDYNDSDFIEFYDKENSNVVIGAYHAQYVKYGSLVYRYTDPKELGAEILKIDPESNHSAASLVRMQNELLKQFDQGSLEPESLRQVMEEEQAINEENMSQNKEDVVEDGEKEETEDNTTEKFEEEVIEEDTGEENVTGENMDTGAETEGENIDENISETENITPGVVPDETIEQELNNEGQSAEGVLPVDEEGVSLPEEIVSFAKRKISKKIKKVRRII